mgnify:CR=1 FL=1
MFVTNFQKSSDGMKWRKSQKDKTLFIRGRGRITDYDSNKPHGRTLRVSISGH